MSWYFDRNLDGFYETAVSHLVGQTLGTKNGQPVHEQYMSGLYEGTGGDSLDRADMSIWAARAHGGSQSIRLGCGEHRGPSLAPRSRRVVPLASRLESRLHRFWVQAGPF